MPVKHFAIVLVLLAGLLAAGCGAAEVDLVTDQVEASPQPTAGGLPGAELLAEGQQMQYDDPEPSFLVITTPQDWAEFWKTHMPADQVMPEVDFARAVVLVGIQGAKSSGGYDIRFTDLERQGDQVRVVVEMQEPAPDAPVETVLTQPYVAVEVPDGIVPTGDATTFVFESISGGELARVDKPAGQAAPRDGDIEPSGPRPTEPPLPGRETFAGAEVLAKGQSLRYEDAEPLFQVITTQQALNELWQTYMPRGVNRPEVDFGNAFVLVGIQGAQSSGGYDIFFTGLEQEGQQVRVLTQWTEPAGDEPVEMTFTQPYVVIRVDTSLLESKGALTFLFETEAGQELGRVPATID
jgi:hypothetical protein